MMLLFSMMKKLAAVMDQRRVVERMSLSSTRSSVGRRHTGSESELNVLRDVEKECGG